jgi:uncharacterized membrane protein
MTLLDVARWLLAAAFIGVGVLHFVRPHAFLAIVPPRLPLRLTAVYLSGVAEIAGGIGVLLPDPWRSWAGWGLIALLVAVFPANIYQAVARVRIPGLPAPAPWLLWARLPLQALFIFWVWRVTLAG